jgi:hypothetical protein
MAVVKSLQKLNIFGGNSATIKRYVLKKIMFKSLPSRANNSSSRKVD